MTRPMTDGRRCVYILYDCTWSYLFATKNNDSPVPHKTSEVATRKIPNQCCKFLDDPVPHKMSDISAWFPRVRTWTPTRVYLLWYQVKLPFCKKNDSPVPHNTSEVAIRKILNQCCKFLDNHVLHKTSDISAWFPRVRTWTPTRVYLLWLQVKLPFCKTKHGLVPHKTSEVATCKIPHQCCKFVDGLFFIRRPKFMPYSHGCVHARRRVYVFYDCRWSYLFVCQTKKGLFLTKRQTYLLQDTTSEL